MVTGTIRYCYGLKLLHLRIPRMVSMTAPMPLLCSKLSTLRDPRMRQKVKHKLTDVVAIAVCAVMGGAETWEEIQAFAECKEEWLSGFLTLDNGIPSDLTFQRIFSMIDPQVFQAILLAWFEEITACSTGKLIAIDGKALRASVEKASGQSPLHLVSAWSSEQSLLLGQVRVEYKSNEIAAIPKLLQIIEVQGSTITIDAMGCQKAIATDIVSRGGDYVLSLKGNQGSLHDQIKQEFDGVSPEMLSTRLGACHETVEKGHGRIEVRRYWQQSQIAWIQDRQLWDGLRSIGIVDSTRIINSLETTERRYFICSFASDPQRFGRSVRAHWRVENTLHWSMDVVFNEDRCRMRRDHSAENFALLRRIALSIFKRMSDKKSRSIKGRRARAGWDNH